MTRVSLSFDNGPDAEGTALVLDTLARHDIRTTFFLVASRLREPACLRIARQAQAEGHWIGNHSLTHTLPLGCDPRPDAPEIEIGEAQRLIGDLAHRDRLFRPFGDGGHIDCRLLSAAARDYLLDGGYSCVLWNVVPRDWEDPAAWVELGLAQCAAKDWSLVVLHDVESAAMRDLDRFIRKLRESECEFVQEFPPACVPIRLGILVHDLRSMVTE